MLLKHSQATEDLERALTFANAAVGKARQAMDAPYSNPQAASAARMKHNTCIMQARSIHKRLEEPNGPRRMYLKWYTGLKIKHFYLKN